MVKKVFLCLLFSTAIIFAEGYKFAWIHGLQIGKQGADRNISSFVDTINQSKIRFVVISGNISYRGKNSELVKAKEILDKLTVPYYIIPGSSDWQWSESGTTKFIELWDDDKFSFEFENDLFIGLNSCVPLRDAGHFTPEDLRWLKDELLNSRPNQEIYFFTFFSPRSDINNWFKVANLFNNFNVRATFLGDGTKNEFSKFKGITEITSTQSYSEKNGLSFIVIDNKPDTLILSVVTESEKPKIWDIIKKNNLVKIDSTEEINYKDKNVEILWQSDLQYSLLAEPIVWNDKIYIADKLGLITCFGTNGKKLWEFDAFGDVISSPVITDGILAVATLQGDLLTIDGNTGESIQAIGFDDAITSQLLTINYQDKTNLMIPKATNSNAAVIFGTPSGKIYCYDLETLQEIWANDDAKGMIRSKPLYSQNKIICGSMDGYLYSIDAKKGWLIWKWSDKNDFFNAPAFCNPVTNGKNVFISTPDGITYGIDLSLGKTKWKNKKFNSNGSLSISNKKDRLYIKSEKNKLHIVSANSGKWVKELNIKFGSDKMPGSPLEWEGNVIFPSSNGYIYLVDKKFNDKKLIYVGAAPVHSVINISDNLFLAANFDGKIIVFKINKG